MNLTIIVNALVAIVLVAFGFFLGAAYVNTSNRNKELDEISREYFKNQEKKKVNPNPDYKPPMGDGALYD